VTASSRVRWRHFSQKGFARHRCERFAGRSNHETDDLYYFGSRGALRKHVRQIWRRWPMRSARTCPPRRSLRNWRWPTAAGTSITFSHRKTSSSSSCGGVRARWGARWQRSRARSARMFGGALDEVWCGGWSVRVPHGPRGDLRDGDHGILNMFILAQRLRRHATDRPRRGATAGELLHRWPYDSGLVREPLCRNGKPAVL